MWHGQRRAVARRHTVWASPLLAVGQLVVATAKQSSDTMAGYFHIFDFFHFFSFFPKDLGFFLTSIYFVCSIDLFRSGFRSSPKIWVCFDLGLFHRFGLWWSEKMVGMVGKNGGMVVENYVVVCLYYFLF